MLSMAAMHALARLRAKEKGSHARTPHYALSCSFTRTFWGSHARPLWGALSRAAAHALSLVHVREKDTHTHTFPRALSCSPTRAF